MLKLLNRAGHKETREDLKDTVVALHKELAEVYERERGRDAACARRVQRAEAETRELREQIAGLQMRASICADERDRLRSQLNDVLAGSKYEYKHSAINVAQIPAQPLSESPGALKDTQQLSVNPAEGDHDEDSADGANVEEEDSVGHFQPSLTIVYDLDGLEVSNESTKESLTALLKLSGTLVVGITDGTLAGPTRTFWDLMPLNARISKRCLLFCETSMVLYRSNETGETVVDYSYGPFPGNAKRYLQPAIVKALVDEARTGLKEWFTDLQATPSLLEDSAHFLHGLASRWSIEDAPVSNDPSQTPRIELRGEEGASLSDESRNDQLYGCAVFGIPAILGDKYLTRRLAAHPELRAHVQGQPVTYVSGASGDGQIPPLSLTYMASVHGLSKRLVLDFLLREGLAQEGRTVILASALGCKNSELAEYHEDGMPFVSFLEDTAPAAQRPAHLQEKYCVEGGPVGGQEFVRLLAEAAAARAVRDQCTAVSSSDGVGDVEREEEGAEEESGWLSLGVVAEFVLKASNRGSS